MKFIGNVEELKSQLSKRGFSSYNEEYKNGGYCFRFQNGSILNFWPSNGSVNLQGKTDDKLSCFIHELCGNNTKKSNGAIDEPVAPAKVEAKGKVFVVHGHDNTAREQLELILHKLGIEPFVLQNTSGGGLTIIEALEKEIGHNPSEVTFGIVLLTPDDMGYPRTSKLEEAKPRARQNVVLEMGMLLSSIGRSRVAILKKGDDLEVPSDANGIVYIPFKEHVKEVVPKLVERLDQNGFKMKPENIAKASS